VRPKSSSVKPARAALIATVATLAVAGCAGDETVQGEGPVTVYVSLPLRGPSGADGQDAADAAELALAEAGGEAAGREVRAVVLDDTEGMGERASWTPQQAAANARQATEDSTSIAYIGDFESGATRSSLPITNEARLLQVSPASSAVDLVAPFPGSDDVPEVQPSGERTFGRVIPSDTVQASAAGTWASELGAQQVALRVDESGFGQTAAEAFEASAVDVGIEIVSESGAQLTYLAGEAPGILHRRPGTGPDSGQAAIASDALLAPATAAGAISPRAGPLYVTSAALDPSQLPAAGQEFADRFRSEYGREPGRYAAYGYEAMAVVLDAIERASDGGTDREAVIDAFLETSDRDSVLGTYSIDEVGDTSLDRMTGYQVDDRARPVAELTAP
jgi:branched-chain amino acid transport system substrate-binding protein